MENDPETFRRIYPSAQYARLRGQVEEEFFFAYLMLFFPF